MSIGAISAIGGPIVAQGELAVGNATVPFATSVTPVSRVFVCAPSSRHTKGGANTSPILIGGNKTSNASGGHFLDTTNNLGFMVPFTGDLSKLYATGFNANDVVEFIAYG